MYLRQENGATVAVLVAGCVTPRGEVGPCLVAVRSSGHDKLHVHVIICGSGWIATRRCHVLQGRVSPCMRRTRQLSSAYSRCKCTVLYKLAQYDGRLDKTPSRYIRGRGRLQCRGASYNRSRTGIRICTLVFHFIFNFIFIFEIVFKLTFQVHLHHHLHVSPCVSPP